MSDAVKEYNLESGKILEIHQDEDPQSPRECDNLGTVWCSHRNYSLSDKHAPKIDTDDHDGWDAIEQYLIKEEGACVILPIYMYEHSGITINTTGFSCGWDSGRVGFIYCTVDKIKAEYSCKRITKKLKENVKTVLESEIKTYDQYVTGDVYGFKIMKYDITTEKREQEDSCWGFFGDDPEKNGMSDHLGKNDGILQER